MAIAAVMATPARAADHLMEVNEVMTSVGGNNAAQYVEILDPFNEPFPSPPYRLVVYDANGIRLGHHEIGGDAQVVDSNVPMLISTPAADAALGVTGHQALGVTLPQGAGQISFTRGLAEQRIHTLTYGCINTAVSSEMGTIHGPNPTTAQSSQLQPSNTATLGTPTPKAANTAGTAAAACSGGGFARPKAATPVTVKLAPAFNQCTGASPPGMTHGAPLALPSCSPPAQSSSFLTFNAPDRPAPFTGSANGFGSVVFKVTCLSSINPPVESGQSPPCPNAGDQADIKITSTLSDVRCVGAGGQLNCAAGGGSVYSGEVMLQANIRITDRLNGPTQNPGTVIDTPFRVGFQCTSGACNANTSADSVIPNLVQEVRRAVWDLQQVQVVDGGLDGDLVAAPAPSVGVCPPACQGNGGETVFLAQGLFIP